MLTHGASIQTSILSQKFTVGDGTKKSTRVLALIAIYGQLGQLYIDPEYYNQHAGNTATHACSGGTPRGATAVLQGNAGKIEKPSKY